MAEHCAQRMNRKMVTITEYEPGCSAVPLILSVLGFLFSSLKGVGKKIPMIDIASLLRWLRAQIQK